MDKTDRWKRMKELFGAALEQEPGQRSAFLRDACGADDDLRREVESLLSAHEQPNDLSGSPWMAQAPEEPPAPRTIGPYQLIKKLGEGGMGQVWLAEQTAPLHRQVAIKLIRTGPFSHSLLQRFQHERQSLALMDHPSIAKVFEAGSTPEGQPYLVMEYVAGLPITDYCDEKKLAIRERLELFMKVCDAVQHAHQKAIIHRDLKPANILVVEVDGKPVPRIIDFGLAKAAAPEPGEEKMLITQPGIFLGTPGYMSPEQADPDVQDVDTRTDVYSLGVVLYVLLTGFLPFDAKQKPLHELLRQLREDDPLRPSMRIGREKDSSSTAAALRSAEPKQLASLLQGDLDWIAMKALEKDRARRYGTPQELASDIGRYLNHEPVVARPASAGYRARKYVRRHRIGVSVAAGLVLLLAGFAVAQAVQLRRITRERDRANRVTGFVTGMFRVADPSQRRGNSVTARELLEKASKDIDKGLARDPDLRAQMLQVMGQVYTNLGLYDKAQELLTQAVDISSRSVGPKDLLTLASRNALSVNLDRLGRFAEAAKMQRETLELERRVLGPDHRETLASMNNLAWSLFELGQSDEAEALDREALRIRRRTLGPEHLDTLTSITNVAFDLYKKGSYAEAEQLNREALGTYRRTLGPENPFTLTTAINLCAALQAQGHFAEAEQLNRETIAILQRVLGPEHPQTLGAMSTLAGTLGLAGRYQEAEDLFQQIIATEGRVLGPEHPQTAESEYNLACIQAHENKRDESLSHLSHAIDHGLAPATALTMDKDPDLASLHGDPRYQALVGHVKEQVAPARQPK